MRIQQTSGHLTVQAIAGTYVVLLGWHMPETECDGLAGFAIHRTDHVEDDAIWLRGMKTFEATDPGLPWGSLHSSRHHPFQTFMWSDYSAKPGRSYTFRIAALKGPPDNLEIVAETAVTVTTEHPEGGPNHVYFNRGVAASQEFARRFGNVRPDESDPDDPKWEWLSRGLYEGMVAFVEAAMAGDKLRICAYEFRYLPFLKVLKSAVDRGVDLSVIYDAKDKPDKDTGIVFPRDENRKATADAGISAHCIERSSAKSAISHNKFIIRFRGDTPVAVWTGGANFSAGGIFGQSNVGDAVFENEELAQKFADYWELLAADPTVARLHPEVMKLTPTPSDRPPEGTSVIFSPRRPVDILDWYADLAKSAKEAVFMTFAFGMGDVFKSVFREGSAPLRFALMEKATRPMKAGPEREAELEAIRQLRFMDENLFAIGSHLRTNRFDAWLAEKLTGLNSNVRYVHNKFMVLDPLSDDPIVIGGSANFSKKSTDTNDENMLVIRGDRRVADIYLGEFMRLYSHHAFREFASRQGDAHPSLKHLSTHDWWRVYFGSGNRSRRRAFFSGAA